MIILLRKKDEWERNGQQTIAVEWENKQQYNLILKGTVVNEKARERMGRCEKITSDAGLRPLYWLYCQPL